jgi:hypothetical protein
MPEIDLDAVKAEWGIGAAIPIDAATVYRAVRRIAALVAEVERLRAPEIRGRDGDVPIVMLHGSAYISDTEFGRLMLKAEATARREAFEELDHETDAPLCQECGDHPSYLPLHNGKHVCAACFADEKEDGGRRRGRREAFEMAAKLADKKRIDLERLASDPHNVVRAFSKSRADTAAGIADDIRALMEDGDG